VELVDESPGTAPAPSFGASLRAARLSRNVTLDAIVAQTKLNRAFFQDLERNDLSKWPSNQFYRESYLRAYCEAVGLDAREVIDAFRRDLSSAGASNAAAPAARPRRLTPVTIPIILAVTFIVFYSLASWLGPGMRKPPAAAADAPLAPAMAVDAPSAAPAVEAPVPVADSAPEKFTPPPADVALPEAPVQAQTETVPLAEHIQGELVISSTPPGATVLVNGINRGTSPVQVQYLPAGSYTVRFIYPGLLSVSKRATISAERRTVQVSATLEPATAAE
jgi:cytoskeletal protein RodZ